MKIIFIGTTEFGLPTLEVLKQNFDLCLVITQPDKPAGRNKTLTPPPVKEWAQKNNVRFLQPEKILAVAQEIQAESPDVAIVAAFGQIIPQTILDLPKYGSINIHGSVLPKFRGASPIQNAILNNEQETGITLIKMDEKMDHGPVIATKKIPIDPNEGYLPLHKKLSIAASSLILDVLPKWVAGQITPQVQDETRATYTKLLTRADAKIVWTKKAQEIKNQIRALNPEPGTWTTLEGKSLKILDAEILVENKIELPGRIYRKDNQMAVKCGDYSLLLKTVQPEGKKPMSGLDFLNGLKQLESKILL